MRSLSRDELDALWRDYRVVGRRFGLRERDMPRDIDAFEAYMAEHVRERRPVRHARGARAGDRHRAAPAGAAALPALVELVNQITSACCPAGVRRQYGFRWDPVRAVALRGGAEYVRGVAGADGRPRSATVTSLRQSVVL